MLFFRWCISQVRSSACVCTVMHYVRITLHKWGRWSIYSAWKPEGSYQLAVHCAELLSLCRMKSDSQQPPVAKGAATDCSHIWSETIVRAFTNLCLFPKFNSDTLPGYHTVCTLLVSFIWSWDCWEQYCQRSRHKELTTDVCRKTAKDGQTQVIRCWQVCSCIFLYYSMFY